MTADGSPRVDIVPMWRQLNDMLIDLVDRVPDERMSWSPRPELWPFQRLFLHIAEAREQWMVRLIDDGEPNIDIYKNVHTKDEMKSALQATFERIERTFTDRERVDATYKDRWWKEAPLRDGHWAAFHLLEHDIHHRADIFLYLALLDIKVEDVSVP
jgi:uncharacterized damage-inducible protein DinB